MRIIFEGVKDHIIHHLHGKKKSYEMWKVILEFYYGSSDFRKLSLKDKLRNIWMSKRYPIIMYPSKFFQFQDELTRVGETIANNYMVSLMLLQLHNSWDNF